MAGYTKLNLRDDVDDMFELRPFDAIRVGGGRWGG